MCKKVYILFAVLMSLLTGAHLGYASGPGHLAMQIINFSQDKDMMCEDCEAGPCNEQPSSEDTDNSCDGDCSHNCGCVCSTYFVTPFLLKKDVIKLNPFDANEGLSNWIRFTTSSGFYSIWIPPKIS